MLNQRQLQGLDDSHLVAVGQYHRLQAPAAKAFLQLQQAAKADGIDCQLASSYRSFPQQLAIWQKKWRGEKPLLSIDEQLIDISTLSDTEKLHAILTWSALPGTSRHHWGTDMDVFDQQALDEAHTTLQLIQQEYTRPAGPCFKLNNWLNEHAAQFGFERPYEKYSGGVAVEPWHLSYRPEAEHLASQLDLAALANHLHNAQISGLDVIVAHLPVIYSRYVLNNGKE